MKGLNHVIVIILFAFLLAFSASSREMENEGADSLYWVDTMARVHEEFTGEKGTFAHFGDSIKVTLAFWTPLLYSRKNAPEEMEQAY